MEDFIFSFFEASWALIRANPLTLLGIFGILLIIGRVASRIIWHLGNIAAVNRPQQAATVQTPHQVVVQAWRSRFQLALLLSLVVGFTFSITILILKRLQRWDDVTRRIWDWVSIILGSPPPG
jgi:hypothetical protein